MQRSIFDGRPGAIEMPDDFLQSREVVRARISGWWLLDPAAGMNGARIAIQSELTDEQIAATERLLGWIWERHK